MWARLHSTVGSASAIQVLLVQIPAWWHNFHGDWSWNNFYVMLPPSTDSRKAVVSYRQASFGGSVGCKSDWWSGGCGFDPDAPATFFRGDLIMKYFLRSFSPFHWFKKGSCQLQASQLRWLSWMHIWLVIRRLRVPPPPGQHHSFVEIWSWNIFYSHSLPSLVSRWAVVSFWQKNVHNTG